MCTLLLLSRVVPELPLVVAANRDEFLARPSLPPRRLEGPSPVLAGLDAERGGSWMGATREGLFVGLTNQHAAAPADPSLRSRGEVVLSALRRRTLAEALAYLRALEGARYNPFNLALGDGRSLFAAYVRREGVELEELGPGVHVLANDRLGSPLFPKAPFARQRVEALLERPWSSLRGDLLRLLGSHALPEESELAAAASPSLLSPELGRQLQSLCVHTPSYGTRSATLCATSPEGLREYHFVEGSPCTHEARPVHELLSAP